MGTATLEFVGTDLYSSDQTELLVEDSGGRHKVAIGTKMLVGGEAAGVYCGTGKNAEVDFTALNEDLLIDLNNSGALGTATAALYGVKKVIGAKGGDNILSGQDGKSNLLVGGAEGANSLYGGQGGRDTLVGSASSEDTFFFDAGASCDLIENFDAEEDKLVFLSGGYSGASLDNSGHLKLKFADGQESASLTLDTDMRDKVLTYDLGDGEHGAKFGSRLTVTDATADFVNYYKNNGGSGELVLSGTDTKNIWLDGSQGVTYEGFKKLDASRQTGDAILAGGSANENIIAGQGDSSLWGGAGGNDTLTGGSGDNTFYFGKGEGRDTITNSNDEDKVMLYNISLSDIDGTKTGVNKEGSMVIAMNDGSSLTLMNYKNQGAETFQLADSSWRYDKQAGEWQQVNQPQGQA